MKKRSSSAGRMSHYGSEPRKSHPRARLRDLDCTRLRARPSRSALACSRAGNPGGINGRARQQIGAKKEALVACTFEDRENARAGRLTRRITSRWQGPFGGNQNVERLPGLGHISDTGREFADAL